MTKITVIEYLFRMLVEERGREKLNLILESCKNTKVAKLWKILFQTDVQDAELLESRIYEFGSIVKEDDIWGRDIFVCLVAFLNLVIK